MTLSIDKAGRVVLPKTIRDRLGLKAGSELEINVEADGALRLQAKHTQPVFAVVGGVLVHRGEASNMDWNGAIDASREDRIRAVAGSILGASAF